MQCNFLPEALACVSGGSQFPSIRGTVKFFSRGNGVLVVAEVCGLPDTETGFYGFHIHEGGDCRDGFANTGGHFDPKQTDHPSHAGDLPPLLGCNGNAYLAVRTERFCLRDILGKTVVIHSRPDDFKTQPAGNSGQKIACGVIRSV